MGSISRTRGGFVLPIKEPGITADVAIALLMKN